MTMGFRQIALEDKEWVDKCLKAADYRGCDYTFANLYIWKDLYREEIAACGGMMCARSRQPGTGEYMYLFPAGDGDLKEAVAYLLSDAAGRGEKLRLRGFTPKEAVLLEELFPGRFTIESSREEWDYLYSVTDLMELAGKKYHGKRNHIARFKDTGEWRFELLTKDNLNACHDMCNAWYREHVERGNVSVLADKDVVENAFQYFEELGLTGGVLYQFGQVVAFAMGEPLNSDTYVVHVEKAFADVNGAYPMINQQYVAGVMQGYTYVNREEDDGIEGLRKAKESYHPVSMVEKCTATEN